MMARRASGRWIIACTDQRGSSHDERVRENTAGALRLAYCDGAHGLLSSSASVGEHTSAGSRPVFGTRAGGGPSGRRSVARRASTGFAIDPKLIGLDGIDSIAAFRADEQIAGLEKKVGQLARALFA